MNVANRIRELREDKKLSQDSLAKMTGLSSSSIARWELGQSEPTASAIAVLCDFFGVTSDYLLGRTDY